MTKAGLATVLATTTLTAAAPADAQRYWRDRGRGGDAAAGAIIGGVIGLGLGAAIASSNRDRYYDRGYYDDRYYAPPRRIYRDRYYAPPPPRGYWRGRGYDRGYGNGYYDQPYRGYYGW
ncbi:hypothetical protein [Sphingomonas sp. Leaf412]|uniref:hypothetical protein n=1 Tax=Sphingomonas sp. Leaf412 TaxID=1736370 RepID=UPI001F301795|nr:hypothetical protein [Sphingomonas sp. Leaf412]